MILFQIFGTSVPQSTLNKQKQGSVVYLSGIQHEIILFLPSNL